MRAMLFSAGLLGCGAGKAAETGNTAAAATTAETADACLPTWDGWADGFFSTWCRSCHSETAPDRRGAPVGTDLDTEAQAIALLDRIRTRVVDEGTMPMGGGVPADEMQILEAWLSCVEP